MIQSVTDFIDEDVVDDEQYRHIQLYDIERDWKLDFHAKLDRSLRYLRHKRETVSVTDVETSLAENANRSYVTVTSDTLVCVHSISQEIFGVYDP